MVPASCELLADDPAPINGAVTALPVPDDCHPKIAAILDYWRSRRPGAGLPGRQHIDPADIPDLLPNLWMIDVVRNPMRFRMRLVGTRVVAYAGEDNTGRWIDERWPDYDDTALRQVTESQEPSWWRGPSQLRPEKTYVELERIRLPMARDGSTVDMILCLTIFYDQDGREVLGSM